MKRIDRHLVRLLAERAEVAPRRRINHNLHPTLDDPVQRFCNALALGSYVRPHRHVAPPKWELFAILHGAAAVLTFDADGRVRERVELGRGGGVVVEVPPGTWHTVVALDAGAVLLEVKEGPYQPVSGKDFATWAPGEGGADAGRFVQWFGVAQPGDGPPGG